MSASLSGLAMIFGSVVALVSVPCVFAPERAREWMRLFPRNKPAGRILAAVDLVWAAWLVLRMPLGEFDRYKPLVYILTPLLFLLITCFMDELLAPRALGGLFALVPAPLLDAARWHESELRLAVPVLAYVLAIAGIVLLLSPHEFRKGTNLWSRDSRRCRMAGAVGLAVGVFVLLLGMTVY